MGAAREYHFSPHAYTLVVGVYQFLISPGIGYAPDLPLKSPLKPSSIESTGAPPVTQHLQPRSAVIVASSALSPPPLRVPPPQAVPVAVQLPPAPRQLPANRPQAAVPFLQPAGHPPGNGNGQVRIPMPGSAPHHPTPSRREHLPGWVGAAFMSLTVLFVVVCAADINPALAAFLGLVTVAFAGLLVCLYGH